MEGIAMENEVKFIFLMGYVLRKYEQLEILQIGKSAVHKIKQVNRATKQVSSFRWHQGKPFWGRDIWTEA